MRGGNPFWSATKQPPWEPLLSSGLEETNKPMPAQGAIKYDDLLSAFEWVNASYMGDNSAFVHRKTGAIHWDSNSVDVEDALPDDMDDGSLYVASLTEPNSA